jgi:CTP:molybdopterin cytidylyltransferase MocA
VTGIVVLSVDRPHVRPATVAELVDAHRRDPSAIWQPKYRARLGHPILYPADLFDEILALDPSSTMRSLLARPDVRGRRCAVEVDDPAVLDNIDTPQDWERLRGLV